MGIGVVVVALVVVGILGGALVLVHSQLRKSPSSRRRRAPRGGGAAAPRNPYRATSIVLGENPCAAAQDMAARRHLVEGEEVPLLPLPGCNAPACNCTYRHHGDRRDEEDDRRGIGSSAHWLVHSDIGERRSGRERRSD